jgi:hypothetical protein
VFVQSDYLVSKVGVSVENELSINEVPFLSLKNSSTFGSNEHVVSRALIGSRKQKIKNSALYLAC